MYYYFAKNAGPWVLALLCCVWPLIVHLVLTILVRRVKEHGWKSLIFGVDKHDQ